MSRRSSCDPQQPTSSVVKTEGPFIDLEPLASDTGAIDFEQILYQTLVNDGKHIRVLNAKRPQFTYNEKVLRESAAAEVAQTSTVNSDESSKGSKRRKLLTIEDKAQQNRDRNREHAKNTRLRKKAYVLKLKELVDHLTQQKEIDDKERKILGSRIYDTHIIRRNAARLLLTYRAMNIQERDKWAAILDESFLFTLPITPYRHFLKSDIVNNGRVLVGIDAAISDTASLALLIESIGQGSPKWKDAICNGETCRPIYTCSKEDMIAAGDLIMCKYVMKIEGYQNVGCTIGCIQHGMLQCKFNKQNKIVAAEMVYDVMGFMQQLQRCDNLSPENSIVPNTVALAMQHSPEARLILNVDQANTISSANDSFCSLMSVTKSAVEAQPAFDILRPATSQVEHLQALLSDASMGRPGSILLRSGDTSGVVNYIKVLPLSDNLNRISHILVVVIDIPSPPGNQSSD